MFRFAVDVSTCLKLTSTYFCSDGQFYEQTEGLQWAHHFFPVVANFFMEDSEKKALEQATHKPVCCFWYLDDTFFTWHHGKDNLTEFLNNLNGLHNKMLFT